MQIRKFVLIAITYILAIVWIVLLARFYSNFLQVPPQISHVLTILSICAGTIGGVIGLIIFYAKQKK
jgi:hypothetical protein